MGRHLYGINRAAILLALATSRARERAEAEDKARASAVESVIITEAIAVAESKTLRKVRRDHFDRERALARKTA